MNSTKVLFLLPYPLRHAPSQRFRVELFLPVLRQAGIAYRMQFFLDEATWKILYQPGRPLQKAWGVLCGYFKRVYCIIFVAPHYSHVFIHREAAPLGPPAFEWVLAKLLRKKIIYDFDDAIWISNTSQENSLVGWIKSFGKVKQICGWSYKVAAGNTFLASWAAQWNKQVSVVPTCVDVAHGHNQLKDQNATTVTIGWTGSHSTLKYLEPLLPVLQKLAAVFNGKDGIQVNFIIISNKPPAFELDRMEFSPWNEATEIEDLLRINIGLMPLQQDAWSEGKCGFKLIQYLALGIPAVASPVGVNKDIVEHGANGFLCNTPDEWLEALHILILNAGLRGSMGRNGQVRIREHYSIQAHTDRFLSLFN